MANQAPLAATVFVTILALFSVDRDQRLGKSICLKNGTAVAGSLFMVASAG
jgi:hypothetical protein